MDSHEKRNGRPIEVIGHYDPIKHIGKIDNEKFSYWSKCGAKPSDRVASIIKKLSTS